MITDKQKGVSLIITFFIMIIILSVILSVSVILYSEVKVVRNIGNSVVSFYAAESGIEKVLYYDRQVIPSGTTRGLCSILNSCIPGSSGETSIYCNATPGDPYPLTPQGTDCGLTTCTNCTIKFDTTFDSRNYSVAASVSTPPYLDVQSSGTFFSTERKIDVSITSLQE